MKQIQTMTLAIVLVTASACAPRETIKSAPEAIASADPAPNVAPVSSNSFEIQEQQGREMLLDQAWAASILEWRNKRVTRLTAPDGWLSLVGLHWLEPGTHSIGADASNAIQLATGPAKLGQLKYENGQVFLHLDAAATFAKIGESARSGELIPDSKGPPTMVRFGASDLESSFLVIERGGKLALRVKDNRAKTRRGFVGIDYFDLDPSWKIKAKYQAHPAGKTIPIASVIGTLEDMPNPGRVLFEKDGLMFSLEAVDEGDGQLFFILNDRTSGKETYGPARFIYADPPATGSDTVVLDFNKAYNPPCAFNAYSTCPLPPPENRLNIAVRAGEKKYRGETH